MREWYFLFANDYEKWYNEIMEDLKKIIGTNIANLRKNNKLTQTEFANKLNYSDKAVSKWENGDSSPDIETLKKISILFGVTLDYLVTDNPDDNKEHYILPKNNRNNKLIITLLSVSCVWLIAVILFACVQMMCPIDTMWLTFVYAVPISAIVMLVFNSIWGNTRNNYFIISAIVWSLLICAYLQFVQYNPWLIFTIGIPAQVAIILWSQLNKPKRK